MGGRLCLNFDCFGCSLDFCVCDGTRSRYPPCKLRLRACCCFCFGGEERRREEKEGKEGRHLERRGICLLFLTNMMTTSKGENGESWQELERCRQG